MPAPRQALLGQIVEASRAAESATKMVINSALAVQAGVASALPEGPAPSAHELQSMLDAQRPQWLQAFAAAPSLVPPSSTHRATDAALTRCFDVLRSPADLHYSDLGLRAIDTALADAAKAFGRGMPQA